MGPPATPGPTSDCLGGPKLKARLRRALRFHVANPRALFLPTPSGLLNEVWGYHAMPTTRTVDVHVAWLRQKLEPNPKHPQYIHTVHGLGYKFVDR
jgi:DNA-binding response OmpR family regulator